MENIPSRNYHAGMERKPYPSETQERFVLRLPDGLRDRVAAAAEAGGRSMNAEFVRRIEQSFEAPSTDADQQLEHNAVVKMMRDTITEVARADNERLEGMRAMGQDLHALCARALPVIDDEERYRSLVRMLADVGVSLQAGDITDAQARMRTALYLASTFAHDTSIAESASDVIVKSGADDEEDIPIPTVKRLKRRVDHK